MNCLFGTGIVAEQAALACSVVNLESCEINYLWQRASFYTDTATGALLGLNLWTSPYQSCTVQCRTQVLPTLGKPRIGIVQGIHQPENKAVERFLPGQTELFDDTNIFSDKAPGWLTDLLQGQFEMWNIARFDSNGLTAHKINGEAIAPSKKYLQLRLVAIEWSIPVLADTAINNVEVGLEAPVHIDNALIYAKGMHGTAVRAWENTHTILHAQRHGRDNMRFKNRKVDETRLTQNTGDVKMPQFLRTDSLHWHPILLIALRVYP
jgi:hypothetical protein